jgi:predicted ATPase
LNLRAGQKDINDKSDFSSAKVHLSAAISFLPGNCWADQYNLTLQIYDEYTNVS